MDELGGKIIDTLAFIKSPVLLIREDARGSWHCVYINEAAKALVGEREDELIADIAPASSVKSFLIFIVICSIKILLK